MEHRVLTPDGRALQVLEDGVPDGVPILVHGGSPNSRLLERRVVAAARATGVRIISYDRPGYGGSDRHEGRTVADCASDVRVIAEALGIERLAVWGASGGGPHAIACAALLPDLVPAVGVLASPAPWGAEGLDYFDGMGELNVEDLKLYFRDRAAAREKCESDRQEVLATTPEGLFEFMRSLLCPVDAAVFTGELAEFMVAELRSGLAPGSDGWWDDGVAWLEPWGFELATIQTPVRLMHGRQDQFVPFAHGEWLAAHIPGVDAKLSDEDGHLTLIEHHIEDLHNWLLARM